MPVKLVPNTFAVDYNQGGENVIDVNNPPTKRYVFQEFPKMLYRHDNGRVVTVSDAAEEKAALAKGFRTDPSPRHDYSQIRNGVAAGKAVFEEPEPEMSAEQSAQLDAEEAEAAAQHAAEQAEIAEQPAEMPAESRFEGRRGRRG